MNKLNRMKRSIYIIPLTVILLAVGCNSDDDSHKFSNKVFISADSYEQLLRVQSDENVSELSYELTVGMAEPLEEDLSVVFSMSRELLDKYRNAYYNETAQLLPDENCNFSSLRTSIQAGNIVSEGLTLNFQNLDQLDYTTDYVMPISISSASGVEVLESARTIYLVFRAADLINVVADINDNLAWVVWNDKTQMSNMEQLTMEVLINANSFTNDEISTVMGVEDHFLLRIGDSNLSKNQINLAYGMDVGTGTNSRGSLSVDRPLLQTGTWYHIAVTFNGDPDTGESALKIYVDGSLVAEKEEASVESGDYLTSVDFTTGESIDGTGRPDEEDGRDRAFWIGFSYSTQDPTARDFDGMIAEARIWNKVLSAEEINAENHFYKIANPEDETNLVAYWKFCDNSGSLVKDYSAYGNDLQAAYDISWIQVELP